MAEMWINMGPQHPMTHGLWNLRIKVDGETIVDAEPEIGYLHRGYEKIMEVREFQKNVVLTDRLCYVASITWSHCYCLACEAAMDIDVPERAKYLRVVSNELQRIASHLMWLAAYGPDLGLLTALLWALRERELFLDLLQLITGARMNQNYPRIGGVRNDAPPDFDKYCSKVIAHFRNKLKEHEAVFEQSKLFQARTVGVGRLTRAQALDWGVTGPNLRACGASIDLRKLDPYDAYPALSFAPAVEKEGDSYARYKVRVEEMKTSCDLILEALKKLPAGPYRSKPPRRCEGEGFRRTEDSRGEALFYVIGDGDDRPYRVKIRSPVFSNIAAAPIMMRGNKVADVVAIMGSIDVCVGEMDK
ncbi:MAG TPA: nickel-dependent hydrogenase large subunit [Thermoplasmata archaeon]|nr:nickel-dependent hydrogenase large subunit [Thermoplasmata archaeon]